MTSTSSEPITKMASVVRSSMTAMTLLVSSNASARSAGRSMCSTVTSPPSTWATKAASGSTMQTATSSYSVMSTTPFASAAAAASSVTDTTWR